MTQLPLFISCIYEGIPCRAVTLPPTTTAAGCVQTPWVCDCGMAGHYSEKSK